MPAPLPETVETYFALREEPARRLHAISFFVLVVLAAALVVMLLWNGLRAEFPRLPRMGYGTSLMVTIAWGLLFTIVLVMISGARELMTPGAWERNGATYRLSNDAAADSDSDGEAADP